MRRNSVVIFILSITSLFSCILAQESWSYYGHDLQNSYTTSVVGNYGSSQVWTENDASAYYTLPIVDVDGNIYALKYELQPPPDVTYSPGWKISIRSLTPDMLPRWTADTICGNSLSVVSSAGMIYEGLKSGCIAVREAATGNLLWSSYNSVNFASWTLRPESGNIIALYGYYQIVEALPNGTLIRYATLSFSLGGGADLFYANATHALLVTQPTQWYLVSIDPASFGQTFWSISGPTWSVDVTVHQNQWYFTDSTYVAYAYSLDTGNQVWRYGLQQTGVVDFVVFPQRNCLLTITQQSSSTDSSGQEAITYQFTCLDFNTGNPTFNTGSFSNLLFQGNAALDSSGILYMAQSGTVAATNMLTSKILFNDSFSYNFQPLQTYSTVYVQLPIGGLAIAGNGAIVVAMGDSIIRYTAGKPLDWKAVVGFVFSGINMFLAILVLIFTRFCKNGACCCRNNGYSLVGGHSKTFCSNKLNATKVIFGLISMVLLSILSILSQFTSSDEVAVLGTKLSDVSAFKSQYTTSCQVQAQTQPPYPPYAICFFPEEAGNGLSPCSTTACGGGFGYNLTMFLQDTCDCDATFFQYQCHCNYATDTCNGTTFSMTSQVQPNAEAAFASCKSHYDTIINVIWGLFATNTISAVLGAIFAIASIIKPDNKIANIVSRISSVVIFIVSLIMYLIAAFGFGNGSLCSNASIPTSLAAQLPGCLIKNDFVQLETQLTYAITGTLLVIVNKPIIFLGEAIHKVFVCQN